MALLNIQLRRRSRATPERKFFKLFGFNFRKGNDHRFAATFRTYEKIVLPANIKVAHNPICGVVIQLGLSIFEIYFKLRQPRHAEPYGLAKGKIGPFSDFERLL